MKQGYNRKARDFFWQRASNPKRFTMRIRQPGLDSPRELWVSYALFLAVFTVAYNLIEGLVSMGFGWADDSVALFGFGADSFIEVGSALLIVWRLRAEGSGCASTRKRRERRAAAGIAWLFLLLALGTSLGALLQLAARSHPASTVPGLLVSALSLSFMYGLWRAKRRSAAALDSRALEGDAACSRACMQLSLVLFSGSLLFRIVPALWWADAVAALILALMIGREGWQMLKAARHADFDGGCGCH